MPRPSRVSPFSQLHRSASKTVVSLAQQFDVLDIRRDFSWHRRLRVGLGVAVKAEHLQVKLAPEIGVVAFPAAYG